MSGRKIVVKQSAAESIAIAWYIESKGMIVTADKFTDGVYDYFLKWLIHVSPILYAKSQSEEL
jgi:hypothetical protein